MYVQPIFILVNVSDKQITTSENITLRRREFVVSEDGNLFYRAVAFRKDEIGGENMRKSLGRVMVCLRIIQRFWSCRFSPRTPWRILPEKKDHENSIRNWMYHQLCIAPLATHLYLLIVAEERVQL